MVTKYDFSMLYGRRWTYDKHGYCFDQCPSTGIRFLCTWASQKQHLN